MNNLYEFLKEGDPVTISIVNERSRMIGNMLVTVSNILAPQKIIIAGPVVKIAEFIIPTIKQTLSKHSFYGFGKEIDVVSSALKENSGLIGAMSIVLNEFLEHPYEFITNRK
jgi:Transcriptional regulator/sugar kinase